ncbi:MAG: TRAP transporter small permease [Hyphomicrobiales bacterium]|nr:TRAP transporter small permease [Hyphomicrobiales bacterium]MCP5370305.1 TRAP transporter small permease [Hyphomicrobiales bacterium]
MDRAKTFLTVLYRMEVSIAVTAFAAVAVSLFCDVIGREVFGHGIFWAPRLASYCTTVAGMLGFALVVATGRHLRVRAVDRLFPRAADRAMNRVADAVSAGLCFWLAYHSVLYVVESYAIGSRGMGIEIPIWPIQIIVPYVFASGALRYAVYMAYPALRPSPDPEG